LPRKIGGLSTYIIQLPGKAPRDAEESKEVEDKPKKENKIKAA
jgi:hypothetical protein